MAHEEQNDQHTQLAHPLSKSADENIVVCTNKLDRLHAYVRYQPTPIIYDISYTVTIYVNASACKDQVRAMPCAARWFEGAAHLQHRTCRLVEHDPASLFSSALLPESRLCAFGGSGSRGIERHGVIIFASHILVMHSPL